MPATLTDRRPADDLAVVRAMLDPTTTEGEAQAEAEYPVAAVEPVGFDWTPARYAVRKALREWSASVAAATTVEDGSLWAGPLTPPPE